MRVKPVHAPTQNERKLQKERPELLPEGPDGLPRVPGSQRAFLKGRSAKVDLEGRVGKTEVGEGGVV